VVLADDASNDADVTETAVADADVQVADATDDASDASAGDVALDAGDAAVDASDAVDAPADVDVFAVCERISTIAECTAVRYADAHAERVVRERCTGRHDSEVHGAAGRRAARVDQLEVERHDVRTAVGDEVGRRIDGADHGTHGRRRVRGVRQREDAIGQGFGKLDVSHLIAFFWR
jgi:hypothetical protein